MITRGIPIIAGVAAVLIACALLSGCPSRQEAPVPSQDNLLEIPPLDTNFIYEGEPLNWNLAPHPRILASPEGIEYLRENPDDDVARTLVQSAQTFRDAAMSDENFFEPTAPLVWAWAYLLTDDENYLALVRVALQPLLNLPPLVKAPEGANIPFLYQASALGGIYDLLYDSLTDEERDRIETVLREKAFHTLAYKVTEYDTAVHFWALDPDSNYYVTFHSTAGLVAIVLAGVEPDAEALAEHCWMRIQDSMRAMEEENGWREGLTYLDFCWGQFACYFLLALERNTDLKPYDEPWFPISASWASWGTLPDHATIACFGDNEPENYSAGSYIYRVGVLTDDPIAYQESAAAELAIADSDAPDEMTHLAYDLPIFRAMCVGREKNDAVELRTAYTDELTRRFPGIEWAFFRIPPVGEVAGDDDFYCAFKSGVAGYDHNHLDQGSMILAAYSEILLSDPGRGGPDIIRQDPYLNCLFEAGLGHNTLIVGDGCYEDLQLFPDNPEYFAEKGFISELQEGDGYVQYITNNSWLYPTESLTDYRRTFIYVEPGVISGADAGALVLVDRVSFHEPKQHSFLFHTPGEVEIEEPGVARLTNGDARLDYYGFCTVPTTERKEYQDTTWPIRNSTCFYRTTASPMAASDWVHVLIPSRADGPSTPRPEISMLSWGLRVSWQDYELIIMLKSGEGWVVAELPE
jgi:hypothetical protein